MRGLELVACQLQQLAQWVAEIKRIHKAAVHFARVADAALVEPPANLRVGGARDGKGNVMQVANTLRVARRIDTAALVGEHGDQAAVTRVKIEVAFLRHIQVGLLKDEGHAEYALPKVDAGLPIGSDQRDVMDTLGLNLPHSFLLHLACRLAQSQA